MSLIITLWFPLVPSFRIDPRWPCCQFQPVYYPLTGLLVVTLSLCLEKTQTFHLRRYIVLMGNPSQRHVIRSYICPADSQTLTEILEVSFQQSQITQLTSLKDWDQMKCRCICSLKYCLFLLCSFILSLRIVVRMLVGNLVWNEHDSKGHFCGQECF